MNVNNILLPDFIIIGVQKAGTSSIAEYLNQHPEVSISTIKEPNFFPYYNKDKIIVKNLQTYYKNVKALDCDVIDNLTYYQTLFDKNSKLVGEASTHNFYYAEDTIENIKKIYGKEYKKIKIIISLRKPLERAFSAWSMFVRGNRETRTFNEAFKNSKITSEVKHCEFDYYGFSLYSDNLSLFLDTFPNIKVVLFDDLKINSQKVMCEIYNFLDIDDSFIPNTSIQLNPSGKPKNRVLYNLFIKPNLLKELFKPLIPRMLRQKLKLNLQKKMLDKLSLTKEDRQELSSYFYDDIEKLEKMINRELPLWKD